MHTDDLYYELPEHLIAQHPAERRGESRLMVLEQGEVMRIGRFEQTLLEQLRPDDLVVANDTRVLHARVRATRPGGGACELLLLEPVAQGAAQEGRSQWRAMVRPARRLRPDMQLQLGEAEPLRAVQRESDGTWVVELPVREDDVPAWLDRHGEVPLPPYIAPEQQDPDRYQTVYAQRPGSVAAPTAGLHFDEQLWSRVRERCEVATVTLHVGAGTFLPVREGPLSEHVMHHERYEVPPATDAAVAAALAAGRRVVAVGTTTTRVLESRFGPMQAPRTGSTELFITPGYRWGCVGALLTNFHLPSSTLIALVMAFTGVEPIRHAYQRAIEEQMRFYSFGDAMFIHGIHAVEPPAWVHEHEGGDA